MKSLKITVFLALISMSTLKAQEQKQEFYQLKIYSFVTTSQEKALDEYLENAYLPALKKMNISNIGVFKLKSNEIDSIKKIYILTPFAKLSQFENLDKELLKDKTYISKGANYIEAPTDKQLYSRIESILLKAFKDMPKMQVSKLKASRKDRVYELRSYESATETIFKNKVEMFNDGGEIKLFDKLNFNAVFYSEVISGPKMPNLMYMTTFSNQESRDAHWKSFVDSAEWKEMSSLPKYQNNVSHIDITFLYPTEYSDY